LRYHSSSSPLALLFLIGTLACGREAAPPASHSVTIDPVPLRSLGIEEGDSALEFSNVSWALPLLRGEIAVANSGTSAIRFFSRDNQLLRSVGRKGNGPGEFTGRPLYLSLTPSGTLLVLDAGNNRVTRISSAGAVSGSKELGAQDSTEFAWFPRVLPRAYVFLDEAAHLQGCANAALTRVASTDYPGSTVGFYIDQLGYTWAHRLPLPDDSAQQWTVRDLDGRIVGTPTFPARFTPYSISATQVTGRLEDSVGVEHVVVLALRRQQQRSQHCATEVPESQPDPADVAALTATFGSLIQAQEGYYAEHGTYAAETSALPTSALGSANAVILEADKRHWFGLLVAPTHGTTCAGGVGYLPPGWREATPRCR
jgi:hypothetical protein